MESEEETVEFDGWELLHSSDSSVLHPLGSDELFRPVDAIEADSGGFITPDYFSLVSEGRSDAIDESSILSENPSWIDPSPEVQYDRQMTSGNSGSKLVESDHELGASENFSTQTCSEGNFETDPCELADFHGEVSREVQTLENINSQADDSGGEKTEKEKKPSVVVWWKVPFEVVKFCVFRVSPIWSLCAGVATVLGLVLLGRLLYKIKRKTKSLQLKVTASAAIDNKKVSPFMSRAVRLNEAFSVVKRGPMLRPSLPTSGVAPWPVLSMR